MLQEKNNKPIGVFDSGVGGLSVLAELEALLPHENFVYLADNAHVPYGEKSKAELFKITSQITDYFIKHHNIKMMVVACNTATCSAINELRKKYPLMMVGTVPAIKIAGEKTKSGTVGIISTPFTSKSSALKKLIKDHCQNISVINIGCKNLADLIEEGMINNNRTYELLSKYLQKIKNSKADYLVLGSTHYTFLKGAINKILGKKIKLIEGGKAIAKHAEVLLEKQSTKNKQKKRGKTLYLSTGNNKNFSKVASKLMKRKIQAKKVKL